MRAIRTTTISILAVGLLAGSTVGVTAQDAEVTAPVEVTGTDVEGACPGGPSEYVPPVQHNRGYACTHTWTTSDPRLDGTFTRAWNLDFYQDGTGLDFGYATGRLENDGGAWQQLPGLRGGFTGRPNLFEEVEWLVFDGEDAYEGLVAVVLLGGVGLDPGNIHGYIVEAEYPTSDYLAE